MNERIEELADRFSQIAHRYDETHDSEENSRYKACASLVIERADPRSDEVVLDLGTGTGLIALALAGNAEHVVGRDISDGMLERARTKAADSGIENVEFGYGEFRDPRVRGEVDVVVSNFALHHLSDAEKREAFEVVAGLDPRRFVIGDAMYFDSSDPEKPLFSDGVDAATVGILVEALTDAGFVLTGVERVHDQAGVLVAERLGDDAERDTAKRTSATEA